MTRGCCFSASTKERVLNGTPLIYILGSENYSLLGVTFVSHNLLALLKDQNA